MDVLPSNPIEHFAIQEKVRPTKVVNLEKFDILRPGCCIKYGEWYVFSDYGDMNNHIKFLSSDFTKVISGIRDGNGPTDVIGAFSIFAIDDSIYVCDPNHKKMMVVDVVDDSLNVKVCSNGSMLNICCHPLMKNRFIDETFIDSSMYQLKDKDGNIIMRIDYPNDKNLKDLSYIAQNSIYFNTKFCVSPDKKKYAFGVCFTGMYGFGSIINNDSITLDKTIPYYSLDIDEIIDYGGDRVMPSNKSMVNIGSCTGSEKYAIFSYEGHPYGDIDRYANSIFLYTWNGEPYMRLDVGDDNVSFISYDSERNTIIGIAHNPEAQLVEYDMNGIIK